MLHPGEKVKVRFLHQILDCKIISSTSTAATVDHRGVRLTVDRSLIISTDTIATKPPTIKDKFKTPLEQSFLQAPKDSKAISTVPRERPVQKPVEIETRPQPVSTQPIYSRIIEDGQLSKRKSMESLRFGLVPNEVIEEMTIGFEEIKSWILSRLPAANGWHETISQVCGSYGTGKSHMMSVIRYIAEEMGYVTAHVEINGQDCSLDAPDTLSSYLWKTLRAKGLTSETPHLGLYIAAIEKGAPPPQIAPHGIDKIRDNYRTISLLRKNGLLDEFDHQYESVLCSNNDVLASDLQMRLNYSARYDQPCVRKMIGTRVAERPYDFVESLNGTAMISRLAGYKGLVITIDEFEVQALSCKMDRVSNLTNVLINYLKGETRHHRAPLSVFFASVGQDGHLGDKIIEHLMEKCCGDYYPLAEFDKTDCMEIAERMFDLYKSVYSCPGEFEYNNAENIYSSVENKDGHVRQFIKSYIAFLDKIVGPPENEK